MDFWLCRFVLEIHRRYPLASLYQLCCGLLHHLHASGRVEINIFKQAEFHKFCTTLDSEMKRLNSTGQYIHKWQAEPVTVEDENICTLGTWLVRYYLSDCAASYTCLYGWAIFCFRKLQ